MNNICAIIPARYGSTRLNGKPLLEIDGKTIIRRTFEQTMKSKFIKKVIVATDDDRIVNEVAKIDGDAIKIEEPCLNGTERICKILNKIPETYDIIVNVQGDEPFIDPENIDLCIQKYLENEKDPMMVCTTIHSNILNEEDLENRAIGKMVMDANDNIMYCSRSMIPHTKSGKPDPNFQYLAHIGVFVFRRSYLALFLESPNTPAQLAEDIEWLKIIEMGFRIKSYLAPKNYEIGVNTPEDYEFLLKKYSSITDN